MFEIAGGILIAAAVISLFRMAAQVDQIEVAEHGKIDGGGWLLRGIGAVLTLAILFPEWVSGVLYPKLMAFLGIS